MNNMKSDLCSAAAGTSATHRWKLVRMKTRDGYLEELHRCEDCGDEKVELKVQKGAN